MKTAQRKSRSTYVVTPGPGYTPAGDEGAFAAAAAAEVESQTSATSDLVALAHACEGARADEARARRAYNTARCALHVAKSAYVSTCAQTYDAENALAAAAVGRQVSP